MDLPKVLLVENENCRGFIEDTKKEFEDKAEVDVIWTPQEALQFLQEHPDVSFVALSTDVLDDRQETSSNVAKIVEIVEGRNGAVIGYCDLDDDDEVALLEELGITKILDSFDLGGNMFEKLQ